MLFDYQAFQWLSQAACPLSREPTCDGFLFLMIVSHDEHHDGGEG
jgi:hypothetical protein